RVIMDDRRPTTPWASATCTRLRSRLIAKRRIGTDTLYFRVTTVGPDRPWMAPEIDWVTRLAYRALGTRNLSIRWNLDVDESHMRPVAEIDGGPAGRVYYLD